MMRGAAVTATRDGVVVTYTFAAGCQRGPGHPGARCVPTPAGCGFRSSTQHGGIVLSAPRGAACLGEVWLLVWFSSRPFSSPGVTSLLPRALLPVLPQLWLSWTVQGTQNLKVRPLKLGQMHRI